MNLLRDAHVAHACLVYGCLLIRLVILFALQQLANLSSA
jgi:hypothetical protein